MSILFTSLRSNNRPYSVWSHDPETMWIHGWFIYGSFGREHVIILMLFECFGIESSCLVAWFTSYLTDRTYCVVVDGVFSRVIYVCMSCVMSWAAAFYSVYGRTGRPSGSTQRRHGGGGKWGQLPPPTVLGLDPEIRTDPLRSVKV